MKNSGAAHHTMKALWIIGITQNASPLGEGGSPKARDRLPRRGRFLQNGR